MSLFKRLRKVKTRQEPINDNGIVSINNNTDFRNLTPLEPKAINFAEYGITSEQNTALVNAGAIEDDTLNYREPRIKAVTDKFQSEMETYKQDASFVKTHISLGIENQMSKLNRTISNINTLLIKEDEANE